MTDIKRFLAIDARYEDDEPEAKLVAQICEIVRQYAADAGLCDNCVSKLTGPLAANGR